MDKERKKHATKVKKDWNRQILNICKDKIDALFLNISGTELY